MHAREAASFLAGKHDCGHNSFSKDNSANLLAKKKCTEAFRGVYTLRIRKKKIQSNLVLLVVLVLESKGL